MLASLRFFFILVLTLPLFAQAEVAIPKLERRVTDLTQTLSAPQQQQLEQRLSGLEQRTGIQAAVLLVPTTQPEPIFDYGMRVVDAWQLGKKGKDDGILILIAKNDRKSQILVGYGLEGTLPDVRAKRILDDVARPFFQKADFNGGLNAAVSSIIEIIEGKADAEPTPQAGAADNYHPQTLSISPRQQLAFLIALGIFAAGQLVRFIFGAFPAGVLAGVTGVPAIGFVLGSIAQGLVWGAALFMIVLIFRFSFLWLLLLNSGGGRSYGGGGGGGGFSGGGGGFGGGGASGSW